jgi:hypothetical protein
MRLCIWCATHLVTRSCLTSRGSQLQHQPRLSITLNAHFLRATCAIIADLDGACQVDVRCTARKLVLRIAEENGLAFFGITFSRDWLRPWFCDAPLTFAVRLALDQLLPEAVEDSVISLTQESADGDLLANLWTHNSATERRPVILPLCPSDFDGKVAVGHEVASFSMTNSFIDELVDHTACDDSDDVVKELLFSVEGRSLLIQVSRGAHDIQLYRFFVNDMGCEVTRLQVLCQAQTRISAVSLTLLQPVRRESQLRFSLRRLGSGEALLCASGRLEAPRQCGGTSTCGSFIFTFAPRIDAAVERCADPFHRDC